jgi:hypothetical protein
MLKTYKKDNLEDKKFILEDLVPNKLSTYRDLLRKYKKEGNKDKVDEYERLIKELQENKDN